MAERTVGLARGRAVMAALALASAVSAACAPAGASGPVRPATPPPSMAPAGSTTPTLRTPDLQGVPRMLFTGPSGLVASGPGRPQDRSNLGLPPGAWQASAAVGPSAAILLVSVTARAPATAVIGQVVGGRVEPRWAVALPASFGTAVLPGCVSGDGRAVVIADALVYLEAGRVAGTRSVPATVGRCQMLDDGTVAYLAEVDHAVSIWRPRDDQLAVTGVRCDDLAVAGREMACLEDAGAIAIGPLVGPLVGGPTLAAGGMEHLAGPARQVLLDESGDWLAVVARDGAAVAFYRLDAGGIMPAAGMTLLPGETLLGFLGP